MTTNPFPGEWNHLSVHQQVKGPAMYNPITASTLDAMRATDPDPLAPLGPTDAYTFPNGVIVYWSVLGTEPRAYIHAGADQVAVIVPMNLFPVIVATLRTMGLDETDATLVAEAAERARPSLVVPDPDDSTTWTCCNPRSICSCWGDDDDTL